MTCIDPLQKETNWNSEYQRLRAENAALRAADAAWVASSKTALATIEALAKRVAELEKALSESVRLDDLKKAGFITDYYFDGEGVA